MTPSPIRTPPPAPVPARAVHWPALSLDEYADYQRQVNRSSLVQVGGVWWRSVRPFFYRPLDLFADYPEDQEAPWDGLAFGAVQYPVAASVPAPGRIRLIVCEAVERYSFADLRGGMRSDLRRAWREHDIRPVRTAEELITAGYPVYRDFHRRTGYGFRSARRNPKQFAAWARAVFGQPKVRVLGAYHEDTLTAVSITLRVRDTLHYGTFFGNEFARTHGASECMLHAVRSDAVHEPHLQRIFAAGAGMPRGLDRFYLRRGFRYLDRPVRWRGNPLTLGALRILAPAWYRRLTGRFEDPPNAEGTLEPEHSLAKAS